MHPFASSEQDPDSTKLPESDTESEQLLEQAHDFTEVFDKNNSDNEDLYGFSKDYKSNEQPNTETKTLDPELKKFSGTVKVVTRTASGKLGLITKDCGGSVAFYPHSVKESRLREHNFDRNDRVVFNIQTGKKGIGVVIFKIFLILAVPDVSDIFCDPGGPPVVALS